MEEFDTMKALQIGMMMAKVEENPNEPVVSIHVKTKVEDADELAALLTRVMFLESDYSKIEDIHDYLEVEEGILDIKHYDNLLDLSVNLIEELFENEEFRQFAEETGQTKESILASAIK